MPIADSELGRFARKLEVPAGFEAPRELSYEDIRATVLCRDDLDDDVAGINSSLELIQRTRGGGWPTGPVTSEDNYADLVWHEVEFKDGKSFSYVVREAGGGYLGCCYLYPMGVRTPLTEAMLAHDVDVSWWVTGDGYERGYYPKLYAALREWLDEQFPFSAPFYSNRELPDFG